MYKQDIIIEKEYVIFKNIKIPYQIKFQKQKNAYFRIRENKIFLTIPQNNTRKEIHDFLIYCLNKIDLSNSQYEMPFAVTSTEDYFYWCGHKIPVTIKLKPKGLSVAWENDLVILSSYENMHDLKTKMYVLMRKSIYTFLLFRIKTWEETMHQKINFFQIRAMNTKWGVCNFNLKKITINSKVIHYDLKIIDYVLIHELAHLVYQDHSANFWKLVEIYCPYYKQAQKQLKERIYQWQ